MAQTILYHAVGVTLIFVCALSSNVLLYLTPKDTLNNQRAASRFLFIYLNSSKKRFSFINSQIG